jgi:hypothetical protein
MKKVKEIAFTRLGGYHYDVVVVLQSCTIVKCYRLCWETLKAGEKSDRFRSRGSVIWARKGIPCKRLQVTFGMVLVQVPRRRHWSAVLSGKRSSFKVEELMIFYHWFAKKNRTSPAIIRFRIRMKLFWLVRGTTCTHSRGNIWNMTIMSRNGPFPIHAKKCPAYEFEIRLFHSYVLYLNRRCWICKPEHWFLRITRSTSWAVPKYMTKLAFRNLRRITYMTKYAFVIFITHINIWLVATLIV